MHRNPLLIVAAIAVAVSLSSTAPAKALRIALPGNVPATQQVMTADVVVVGKVTEIEKEMSKALPFPGATEKAEFRVAVIKINESIAGANGLTTIRVGFLPSTGVVAPDANRQLRPTIARVPPIVLTEGQEGCFFLSRHPDGDFYVMQQFAQPLDKKAADYDKQLSSVKKVLKVFESPKEALKAKDAADRQFAACMLVQKYRQYPRVAGPNPKVVQESIDAEESKLILTALSEMEWAKIDPNGASLQNTFYQLGLQPKDGWVQPKAQPGQDYNKIIGAAVAKWMKDNADKYRIQRQVAQK